jgi:hypothetical protein
MFLLSQGCCFIHSLHFSYELQEDSMQNSNHSVQFPCIRSDDVVFRPDAHQCLEASNSSKLHLAGCNGKSFGRSSEFEKIPVFQ